MKKYLLAIALVVAFASCSDELCDFDAPNNELEQSPTTVALNLSAESMASPSRAVNEDVIEDVNLFMFGTTANYHFHFATSQQRLEFEVLPDNYRLYVVANSHTNMGEMSEVELQKYQLPCATMHSNEDIPMVATNSISIPASDRIFTLPNIVVKRMAAKISLNIGVASGLASTIKLRSIQLCNLPQKATCFGNGERPSTLPADYYDGEEISISGGYSGTIYMFENGQGIVGSITDQKDKSPENAPPCATYVRILAQGPDRVLEYMVYLGANNTSDFNITRNSKYNINLTIKGEAEIDNRVRVYEGLYYGSANSIVCANARVNFDVTPYRTSKSLAYKYTKISAGAEYEPVRASVLWQDTKGLIAGVSYSNCQVTVTTNGGRGNAVVALYDRANTILWSFHIWCTDTPLNHAYHRNSLGREYVVMDRNLGATSTTQAATSSYGLIYQWGRKDPFVGSAGVSSNVDAKMYTRSGTEIKFTAQATVPTSSVESIAATPYIFFYGYDGWCGSTPDGALWGGDGTSGAIGGSSKSVYDPCPEGCKVGRNDWLLVASKNGRLQAGSSADLAIANHYTYSTFNRGWRLYYDNRGASTLKLTHLPAAGIRNGYPSARGVLKSVGEQGNYWSATWQRGSKSYCSYLNATTIAIGASHSLATGMRVRCVKMD